MTNMSIQSLWLTHFIEILLVLEFQLTKTYFGTFSYKAHFRPQISSNERFQFQREMRVNPYTRRNSTHNRGREDGSNWRSDDHDSKKIPQVMRNMKNSNLEEPLIHLSIWIRNDAIEDDEVEGSRRSLTTKQIKISIQLSFHDIVLLCICLYSVDVLCMIEYLH